MTEMAERQTPVGRVVVKPVFSLPRSIINPNFVLSGRGGRELIRGIRRGGCKTVGGRDIYIYIYTRGVAGS